jgi:anthranilate phosphoribosyltransferase
MIGPLLERIASRRDLTRDEAARLVDLFVEGEATDAQIGAALMGLALKGETAEELAGLATAMRARAVPVTTRHATFVDTAGTGGDRSNTFNISTAAAFVIAAAGLPVAKHGNRAASSRSGSADVLAALGARADVSAERAGHCLDEIGICFMFAPSYHAATRRVAELRRQLGVRTAFNLLGPLTNPARAPRQLVGVFDEPAAERVAHTLAVLGVERAWVVHGLGLDEITVAGATAVFEVVGGEVARRFELHPDELGCACRPVEELRGGTPEENAAIVRGVLDGTLAGARRDVVLLNAAAGLVVGGAAASMGEGLERAAAAVDSGAASELLRRFCDMTNSSAE